MSEKHVSGPAGAPWIVEGGGVERPAPPEQPERITGRALIGTHAEKAREAVATGTLVVFPGLSALYRLTALREAEDGVEVDAEQFHGTTKAEDEAAELAALLPGLAADVATVRATFTRDVPTDRRIERIAKTAELLAGERERQTALVNALEADIARVRAAGAYSADARVATLRERVAELEAERATDPDRAALLATLGRQPVELLRAVAEVVALRVEDVPTSPRDVVEKALELIEAEWHTSFAGPGDEPLSGAAWFACARRMLARIARVALAGIQACAPAPGRPSVLTDAKGFV